MNADKDGGLKGPEKTIPCDWCGRLHKPAELVWVGSEKGWLCPPCRAEAESCGCSD